MMLMLGIQVWRVCCVFNTWDHYERNTIISFRVKSSTIFL